MVVIRLARYGRKKKPFYHIVVADKRRFRNSKFIQKLGFYNPLGYLDSSKDIFIDVININLWISKGAVLSKRVLFIFKKYKDISLNK